MGAGSAAAGAAVMTAATASAAVTRRRFIGSRRDVRAPVDHVDTGRHGSSCFGYLPGRCGGVGGEVPVLDGADQRCCGPQAVAQRVQRVLELGSGDVVGGVGGRCGCGHGDGFPFILYIPINPTFPDGDVQIRVPSGSCWSCQPQKVLIKW